MIESSRGDEPHIELSENDRAILDGDLSSLQAAIRFRTALEFTRIVLNENNPGAEEEEIEEDEED